MKPLSDKQKAKLIAELEASGLNYSELLMECQRVASRAASQVPIGNGRVDKETREILVGQNRIPLSAKEFGVFNLLYANQNSPVERIQIAREVWGIDSTEKNHSIDVCVNHLRTKMEQADLNGFIRTVPGKGYMIDTINPSGTRVSKLETPKEETQTETETQIETETPKSEKKGKVFKPKAHIEEPSEVVAE
jgi:DNA-binding winged helix-turn-helix (wHTH) protein